MLDLHALTELQYCIDGLAIPGLDLHRGARVVDRHAVHDHRAKAGHHAFADLSRSEWRDRWPVGYCTGSRAAAAGGESEERRCREGSP